MEKIIQETSFREGDNNTCTFQAIEETYIYTGPQQIDGKNPLLRFLLLLALTFLHQIAIRDRPHIFFPAILLVLMALWYKNSIFFNTLITMFNFRKHWLLSQANQGLQNLWSVPVPPVPLLYTSLPFWTF